MLKHKNKYIRYMKSMKTFWSYAWTQRAHVNGRTALCFGLLSTRAIRIRSEHVWTAHQTTWLT